MSFTTNAERVLPLRYAKANIRRIPDQVILVQAVREFQERLSQGSRRKFRSPAVYSVALLGPHGVGKSFAAAVMHKAVKDAAPHLLGKDWVWVSAAYIAEQCVPHVNDDVWGVSLTELYVKAKWLVIDACEGATVHKDGVRRVARVIQRRLEDRRPTVITAALTADALGALYGEGLLKTIKSTMLVAEAAW